MGNRAINYMEQPEDQKIFIHDIKTVVVVVNNGQTKQQIWQSHLSKNPEDCNADVIIFHFAPQKAP